MLTLLMKPNKSLIISTPEVRIYQRESYMDTLRILLPIEYDGIDLAKYTVTLEYIDPVNLAHAEQLVRDEDEIYKNKYYAYYLPIDSLFTAAAGKMVVKVSAVYLDLETLREHVLHTGENKEIEVLTWDDYFAYTPSVQIAALDRRMLELQKETQELAEITLTLESTVPDDLMLTEDLLQLSREGNAMGQGVELPIEPIVSI